MKEWQLAAKFDTGRTRYWEKPSEIKSRMAVIRDCRKGPDGGIVVNWTRGFILRTEARGHRASYIGKLEALEDSLLQF